MNQTPFPFSPFYPSNNLEQRLGYIENELREINEKLDKLLKPKQNKYLQNDDDLYML